MPADVERACFGRLMALSDDLASRDNREVTQAVDRVLACCRRRHCRTHLACSWMASDLASRLMERFR